MRKMTMSHSRRLLWDSCLQHTTLSLRTLQQLTWATRPATRLSRTQMRIRRTKTVLTSPDSDSANLGGSTQAGLVPRGAAAYQLARVAVEEAGRVVGAEAAPARQVAAVVSDMGFITNTKSANRQRQVVAIVERKC